MTVRYTNLPMVGPIGGIYGLLAIIFAILLRKYSTKAKTTTN